MPGVRISHLKIMNKRMVLLNPVRANFKFILRKKYEANDTDRNEFIEYNELLAAALPSSLYLREDYLHCAFDMFDKDGSGKIDMIELGQILQGEEN
jgi:Ca2+-binding EF-hand superfamily protein